MPSDAASVNLEAKSQTSAVGAAVRSTYGPEVLRGHGSFGGLYDGGRVLGVTAWADDLPGARAKAYRAVELIHWPGATFRRDIGAKGLRQG